MIDVGFSSLSNVDQENINTNTFITFFGKIHQVETMTEYLANHFFDPTITGADLTLAPHESDFFTYITSERYTFDKFYGITIDKGASKQSTAGYGKFLEYKKKIKHFQVDKSRAGAATFNSSLAPPLLLDLCYWIPQSGLLNFMLLRLTPHFYYVSRTWISLTSISTTARIYSLHLHN